MKFASVPQNPVLDGWTQVTVAVEFGASLHENVLTHIQIAKAAVCPLHPADSPFTTFAHDHHQVEVAVLVRRTPRMRAKHEYLLRLEFGFQPLHCLLQ